MEEATLIAAVAASVDGIDPEHFGETECVDDGQRRRLRTSSVSVAMEIAVSATGYFDDDGEYSGADLVASITSTLSTAVSSGALDANIASAAADAGSTVLTSTRSTTIVVATKAPSAAPTPVPKDIENQDTSVGSASGGSSSDDNVVLLLAIILVSLDNLSSRQGTRRLTHNRRWLCLLPPQVVVVFCTCAVCVGAVAVCKMSKDNSKSNGIPGKQVPWPPEHMAVPAVMLSTPAVMVQADPEGKGRVGEESHLRTQGYPI